MKACKTCGHTLPLTDFRPEPRVPDGREAHCKPCQRVIDRKYREKYREQRLAYQRLPGPETLGEVPGTPTVDKIIGVIAFLLLFVSAVLMILYLAHQANAWA